MEMLSKLSLQGGDSCTFFMLDAAFVRKFPGKSLPFFQEIRDQYTTDVRSSKWRSTTPTW